MKIIYTILFFANTLLLVLLTFLLLKKLDSGISTITLFIIIAGMLISITSLIFSLYRYLKVPQSGKGN
jgi:hypothetical protein